MGSNELVSRLEKLLEEAELLAFLHSRHGDGLKLHHQFRLTLADCPNCCSQPQIKDVGIIGQARIDCQPEECTACGECENICDEAAIQLKDGFLVAIHPELCVLCGACARVCPTAAINHTHSTYRVLVGGKLGRHPQLALELASDLNPEEVLALVGSIVDFYKANANKGQRLGALINQMGWEHLRLKGISPGS
jgi:dissimilatory sulfite reductase (desulfoviridin) alpha/beta subunit